MYMPASFYNLFCLSLVSDTYFTYSKCSNCFGNTLPSLVGGKMEEKKSEERKKRAPLILCNVVYFFVYQNNVNVKKA